jgi:Family of unknown function (DUF5670)
LHIWFAVEIGSEPDDILSRCWKLRQPTNPETEERKVHFMLYTIAVVLLILWLLGLVTSYTVGGFIHILLVVAIIMIVFNLISGRRAL